MIQSRSREQIVGLLAIAPALFLILALTLYPVAYSIWLSLLEKHSFFPQERFVGLENFFYLWKDEEFWTSLWLGTVYSVWTILFQIILGVAAALILNESFVGRGLVRAIVLFPYMIPTIVAVILWKWLLNDTYGVVNYWMVALGIVRDPVSWLGTDHIMLSVIAMSIWQFFPFVLLTILARLQTIPPELYEAAKVDGASAVRRFIHVTLPQIRGILFVVILLRSIWMFTKFDTVWLMGEGAGAGRFIRTLPVYALCAPRPAWGPLWRSSCSPFSSCAPSSTFTCFGRRRTSDEPFRPRRWLSTRGLLYGGAALLVLQAAFPFFWMISTSFKPPVEVFAQPPSFIPDDPTWDNFHRLFTATSFLTYFWNSVIVSGLSVLLTMIGVSAAGAYNANR